MTDWNEAESRHLTIMGALERMDEQPTQANIVKCHSCGHQWIGFYLPLPISQAVKIMKNLTCPKCAADASQIMVFDGTAHSAPEQP